MNGGDVTRYYYQLSLRLTQESLDAKMRNAERHINQKPREAVYNAYMAKLDDRGFQVYCQKEEHVLIMPPAYDPCYKPPEKLKHILITDLLPETHNWGKYLLLRTITPPTRRMAIITLAEDEKDNVTPLELYYQEDEKTWPANDLLGLGTVLLVKQPYYTVQADGEYGVRVDHTSDVIRLENSDLSVPAAWRTEPVKDYRWATTFSHEGHLAMGKANYWDAIAKYRKALNRTRSPSDAATIKHNRAVAFFQTKQFDDALLDTGFPTFTSEHRSEKAFCAAEALYNLERFSDCATVLNQPYNLFACKPQVDALRSRALDRVKEQESGDYNFDELQATAKSICPPYLDHATYIGPVKEENAGRKGRGLFVTKAVKAGDLLLCEKAFSAVYTNKEGSNSETSIRSDMGSMIIGAQADLINDTVRKLHRNRSVRTPFLKLYDGTYKGTANVVSENDKDYLNSFLVERIVHYNVFGGPISNLLEWQSFVSGEDSKSNVHHSRGIWLRASYINHSCFSNASRAFIGDMMVVRATRDMEAGTEITFSYYSHAKYFPDEVKEILGHWDISCDCPICQENSANTALTTLRRKLSEGIVRGMDATSGDPEALDTQMVAQILIALEGTYIRAAKVVPRLRLWRLQLQLGKVYLEQNNIQQSLLWFEKVLTSLGFTIVGADTSSIRFEILQWGLVMGELVLLFLDVAKVFQSLSTPADAECALKYAKMVYKMVIGEDSTFHKTFTV